MIDVSNIDPAALLASLYNASWAPMSLPLPTMTIEDARKTLAAYEHPAMAPYFDYLRGRVMKVEINGKTLDPAMYDRDNGAGAAQRVVDSITEEVTP